MSPDLRHAVDTPINGHQWPVAIPIDTTLDRVRIELLNLGAEYVWLDVLCLRQEGEKENEKLRLEEWRLDVPTIGNVYRDNIIVHYYSGLGRPFQIGDLNSDRHWLNRAWTVQEVSSQSKTAGIVPDSPRLDGKGGYHPEVQRFSEMLAASHALSFQFKSENVFPVLEIMRRRAAVNELDKIAGLAYLLHPRTLPGYVLGQDPEVAWTRLLEAMGAKQRGILLFLYPAPGDGKFVWAPSWKQIKEMPLPETDGVDMAHGEVTYVEEAGREYRYLGHRIHKCIIEGLAVADRVGRPRRGTLTVTAGGATHQFLVIARHQISIPEKQCTLIGTMDYRHWVVGKFDDSGYRPIVKISVVEIILTPENSNEMANIPRKILSGFF
jgi:hypothetical protein